MSGSHFAVPDSNGKRVLPWADKRENGSFLAVEVLEPKGSKTPSPFATKRVGASSDLAIEPTFLGSLVLFYYLQSCEYEVIGVAKLRLRCRV